MKTPLAIRIIVPTIFITVILPGSSLTNKQFSFERNAIENTNNTSAILSQEATSVQKTFISNFQKFVTEADTKISANIKKISKLKNIYNENSTSDKLNINKLNEFESINSNLKLKLDTYVMNGSGNWESFRETFLQELKQLDLTYSMIKI